MEKQLSTLERRLDILSLLNKNSLVRVGDLVEKYNVSEVTIRKDFTLLEKKRQLIKIRGGAIANQTNSIGEDESVIEKQQYHLAEKQRIGKAAAALINEEDTIILDSGTTTIEVARNLQKFNNLTIITNAINVASALNEYKKYDIIIPGGYLRHTSFSLTGHIAESFLKSFYCDKLFLGVDSFSLETGISTPVLEEARINQIMISISKEVIAVCDSSKFNKRGFAFITNVDKIDVVVTDKGIPANIHNKLLELGKKVIIV